MIERKLAQVSYIKMTVLLPQRRKSKRNTNNPHIVFVKTTNTPKYTQKPTNKHDRGEIGPSVIYKNDSLATATQEIQKKITKNPQIVFEKSTNTPKYTKKNTNTHDREEIGPSVIYQIDCLATATQKIHKYDL